MTTPVQVTCLRGIHAHYIVNNLIDGGLKITQTGEAAHGGRTHYAIISEESSIPIRFIIELLEKYEPTDIGRLALEHYLSVIHAFWHD